jgi:hypothetical protein
MMNTYLKSCSQLRSATSLLTQNPQRYFKKVLTKESLSPNVLNCEYAVRGKIPIRGEEISKELKQGKKYPFDQTISLNIGNPQAVG